MGKTFDQSLIDTANIPMSMIDPEDMMDTSSEEFVSMRRVQQGCHSELTNREDFPFEDRKNVIDTDGKASYTITIGSTLQMPERVQHLYFDALEYRVLYENTRKQSNPRWQPTLQLFNEKWQVFLRASRESNSDTYFII